MNDSKERKKTFGDACPEEFEFEAAQVSLAGQVTAILATGAEIVEARLDDELRPIIRVDDHPLYLGFGGCAYREKYPFVVLQKALAKESETMQWRILLAQMRTVLAGNAALDLNDTTTRMGFRESASWDCNKQWVDDLLDVATSLLGIGENAHTMFNEIAWSRSLRLISENRCPLDLSYYCIENTQTPTSNFSIIPEIRDNAIVNHPVTDELVEITQKLVLEYEDA